MLLASLLLIAGRPSLAQDPYAKLRLLPSVQGQISFSYTDQHTKSLENGATIEFKSSRSGTAHGKFLPNHASDVQHEYVTEEFNGSVSVSDSIVYNIPKSPRVAQSETAGGPIVDSQVALSIDWTSNTYSISGRIYARSKVTLTGPGANETTENVAGIDFATEPQPLPKDTGSIRGTVELPLPPGSVTLGSNIVPQGLALMQDGGKQSHPVKIQYQFGQIEPSQEVELIVETDGWDKWMPEATNAPNKDPGNRFGLVAKLRTKDGSPLKSRMAWVRFELVETSKEPGRCLNHPVRPDGAAVENEEHDLKFLAEGDAKLLAKEDQAAETPRGAYQQATATVGSFDWGGTTMIKVTAHIPNQGELQGTFTANGERTLLLPKRTEDSRIADAWREAQGVTEKKDLDDDEESEGNKHVGDGYSLYEEYRGVIAEGQHSRKKAEAFLNPKVKDLVVLLGTKAPRGSDAKLKPMTAEERAWAKSGFRLFESAVQKARIVEMRDEEAPESRQINANSSYGKAGDQHGVLLIAGVVEDTESSSEGSTVGGAFPLSKPRKTPKLTTYVTIDFSEIKLGYDEQAKIWTEAKLGTPYTLTDEMANTVAHELGHALGINHHGSVDLSSPYYPTVPVEAASPIFKILASDGSEISDRPYRLRGNVGRNNNRASGDTRCIMTYNNYYTWVYTPVERGGTWQAILPTMKPGTIFCTGKDGDPENKRFGPAGPNGGNCLSKLRFRDFK